MSRMILPAWAALAVCLVGAQPAWAQTAAGDDDIAFAFGQAEATDVVEGDVEVEQDSEVLPAAFQDTIAPRAPQLAARAPARRSSSSAYQRLARVPNMFGDSLPPCGDVDIFQNLGEGGPTHTVAIPCPGGGGATKIAENDKALPVDRVFFYYNGFHNAFTIDSDDDSPGGVNDLNFHRYTIGFEKTFNEKQNSFEIRMPLTSGFDSSGDFDSFINTPGLEMGEVGNLAFVLKHVLWSTGYDVVALGLSFDVPTGDDVVVPIDFGDRLIMHNDAAHFAPFVGFLSVLSDRCFTQGFVQLGIPLAGNDIEFQTDDDVDFADESDFFDELKEQNLLYVDLQLGYWLDPRWLAGVVELHYTTTLEDADDAEVFFGDYEFFSMANRVDFLNLALGLHADVTENTNVRLAGVLPLRDGTDKPFDAEIQVSVNHYY